MSVACRDIFTDRASITTRIFLSRRTATITSRTRRRRIRSGAMRKRRPLTTEEHLEEEVEAAEPAKGTGTAAEAGEPLMPLLKAELPVRRRERSKPDPQGISRMMGLKTPTWMPRR